MDEARITQLVKSRLGVDDNVLPEYITVMFTNGKSPKKIAEQLEPFCGGEQANAFSDWLFATFAKGSGPKRDPAEDAPPPPNPQKQQPEDPRSKIKGRAHAESSSGGGAQAISGKRLALFALAQYKLVSGTV